MTAHVAEKVGELHAELGAHVALRALDLGLEHVDDRQRGRRDHHRVLTDQSSPAGSAHDDLGVDVRIAIDCLVAQLVEVVERAHVSDFGKALARLAGFEVRE